jgi:hypothetical protein
MYVTPTAVAAKDLIAALALPPFPAPPWALLLNPSELTSIRGPRRIAGGSCVEYILENGFSVKALAPPGWALDYR